MCIHRYSNVIVSLCFFSNKDYRYTANNKHACAFKLFILLKEPAQLALLIRQLRFNDLKLNRKLYNIRQEI